MFIVGANTMTKKMDCYFVDKPTLAKPHKLAEPYNPTNY
jgi:hypothetical protein